MKVNGVHLHAVEMGTGPPVVMLHGVLVGNLATWYFGAAPLISRRNRVFLYDLRGHGLSERATNGYDLATMSADLAALVEHLRLERVSMVGHSYGGLVALRWAIDHPEKAARLVLVDAPYPLSDVAEFQRFLELPPERMLEALPGHVRAQIGTSRRQGGRFQRSVEFLAAETTLLQDLQAESGFDPEQLSRYPGEVLCVYGESSNCRPGGERLAELLPRGQFVVLQGGHYLPLESPSSLAACLERFLDG